MKVRLLLITTVLLVVGIVASDAVVLGALRRHLVERVDRQLTPLAQLMARVDPSALGPPGADVTRRAGGGLDLVADMAIVYFDPGGRVISSVHTSAVAPEVSAVPRPLFSTGNWRAIVVARPAGGSVAVAGSLSVVDGTVRRLQLICAITGLLLIAALGTAGWFLVRAGLRPLRAIEETATAIAAGDLSHRIPGGARPGAEIGRLTAALNGMLAQLDRAFAARGQFVADVSHELRTPLFGIKGSTELALMGGVSSPAEVERTLRRIDTEAGRLAALVEDLLLLARLDVQGPVLSLEPMDLRTLAASALADLRALDPDRPVRITGPGGAGEGAAAPVLGDEARLRQVVVNLVGNVHAHTPPGAPARIGVGRVGTDAVLEIADSGPGIPPGQEDRLFDRFSCGDASRTTGHGLGLAIVRSLVEAHGGRIEVVPGGTGATFRICLASTEGTQDL
ncbi:HAMP domain-containing histidine kinase [Actinoplanes sp. KI2]|uniref:sensor histidine kinase n=1 Tax=Actinoplanes sp. KI2 TaxID=2983315 RepID=UPI0021D59349|nr:HAMP domain-containing sensor histidine kinase [Actinoplanes sp. KI2]MCU7730336.1 HAMP domain-containing histidine kinase [Actinoplanes sp. KI2]